MEAIDRAIKDAKLHKDEAKEQIREWQIKYKERQRQLETLEILKDKK